MEPVYIKRDEKVNILVSYAHLLSAAEMREITDLMKKVPCRLMIDSGAFTAFSSGKEIKLETYLDWLKSCPLEYTHAIQLDAIGDSVKTRENYIKSREAGVDVIPVFQRGQPMEELDEVCGMAEYIMLGGLVGVADNRPYIKACMERIDGRAEVHWLGCVDIPFVKGLRPRSLDSSAIGSAVSFDTLNLYCGGAKTASYKNDEWRKGVPLDLRIKNHVTEREYQLLSTDIDQWRTRPGSLMIEVNARGHILRSLEVERNIGTKIYLAIGGRSKHFYRGIVDAYHRILEPE